MGKIKADFTQLKQSIIELDDSKLSLGDLHTLVSILPTPEELAIIRDFQGDKAQLDKPEQFFLEIESVPFLHTRVDLWNFARTFDEKVHQVVPIAASLQQAFEQCLASKRLLILLEAIHFFSFCSNSL